MFLNFLIFPVKKSKQMLPLPDKENRLRDVAKNSDKFRILASEIVVLGCARSVFYAAKFKKVKNTGDLTFSSFLLKSTFFAGDIDY